MTNSDETERLRALRSLNVVDTGSDGRLDSLTNVAKSLFDVPIALITLVDEHRLLLKSKQGIALSETPREHSFCEAAIKHSTPLVVPDVLLDDRFSTNALVSDDPNIRFYAGAPIVVDGAALGTICVLDNKPRELDAKGLDKLVSLAEMAAQFLSSGEEQNAGPRLGAGLNAPDRESALELAEQASKDSEVSREFLQLMLDNIPDVVFVKDAKFRHVRGNPAFFDLFPKEMHDTLIGMTGTEEFEPEEVEAYQEKDREAFETGSSVTTERITVRGGDTQTFFTKKIRFEDQDGVPFLLGIARNLTESLEAEKKLAEAKAFQDLIFESLPLPIYVKDDQGIVLRANSAFLEMFPSRLRDQVVGSDAWSLLDDDDLMKAKLALYKQAFEHGFAEATATHRFEDGKLSVFQFKKFRFENQEGEQFVLSMARDITKEQAAEQQLASSNRFQSLIFESMPYATFVKNKEHEVIQANPAFAKLIGGSDIVGSEGGKHFPMSELVKLHATDSVAFEKGSAEAIDELSFLDGSVRTIQSYKNRFEDASGEPFILCIAIDITDRILAQREVEEVQSFQRLMFEQIPDYLFVKDEEFRIVQANQSFLDLYPEEVRANVIGTTTLEQYDEEEREDFLTQDRLALKTGKAETEESIQFPDGSRRILLTKKVRFEDQDAQKFVLGIGRDITELVEARQAQEDASILLENIFETVSGAVIGLDENKQILMINQAGRQMLAGDMDTLPFKWPENITFLAPEDLRPLESSHDPIARALIGQKVGGEVHLMTSIGSDETRYVRVTSALVRKDNSPLHSVIVMDDVSEAEKNRQQIERQSRLDALGQLTGGIAHDINNLLNTMQYALALIGREDLSERGQRSMTAAQKSIGRGSDLTTRLLAFAKKQPARAFALPVVEVFDELKGLVTPAIEASIRLEFEEVPEGLIVFCDQGQLQNAALNLILNSRDAILKEGKGHNIRVSARAVDKLPYDPEGISREEAVFSTEGRVGQEHDEKTKALGRAQRYVELSVSDNGPGMSRAVVSRAVDPFFTTKGTNSGTGLGLSMVYGFVQQSEGEIRIYTEEGEGTTVKLFLPFGDMETGREEALPLDPMIEGKGETIMVVEDEPYLLGQLSELLEALNYKPIKATSGREALELIKEGVSFDLLLTDVVMPGGLGGFELARLTREMIPDVPIIYMSGYTGFTDEEMGAVRAPLLPKPSSPAMTSAKIRQVLDKASAS